MVSRVTDSRKTEAPASSRRAGRAGSKQGPGHVGPTGASFSASFPGGALDVGTSAAAAGALDSNVALEALDTLLTVQENSGAAADSGAPFPDHEAAIDWSENVLRRLGELRVRLFRRGRCRWDAFSNWLDSWRATRASWPATRIWPRFYATSACARAWS